jgi:hypothetical protein
MGTFMSPRPAPPRLPLPPARPAVLPRFTSCHSSSRFFPLLRATSHPSSTKFRSQHVDSGDLCFAHIFYDRYER